MAARRKTNKAESMEQVISSTHQKSKRSRFLEIAPRRANKALQTMRQLERCANRASYEYAPHEAAEIISKLEMAVDRVRDAFYKVDRTDLEVHIGGPLLDMKDAGVEKENAFERGPDGRTVQVVRSA